MDITFIDVLDRADAECQPLTTDDAADLTILNGWEESQAAE